MKLSEPVAAHEGAHKLFDLTIGDVVEAGRLMPVLCEEPVVFALISLTANKKTAVFEASFWGIRLGRWQLMRGSDTATECEWRKEEASK